MLLCDHAGGEIATGCVVSFHEIVSGSSVPSKSADTRAQRTNRIWTVAAFASLITRKETGVMLKV